MIVISLGILTYLADIIINLRSPWACYIRTCYIDNVLTVKDYNNSIRRKDAYLYFNETLTAYNLNFDTDVSSYPYAPQANAIDPRVIDILNKNKPVEMITDTLE